jgi:hypothetical protein
MTYYIISYDKTYNRVFGEDCDKRLVRRFDFMAFFKLAQEDKTWSRFSIDNIDNFEIQVSKDHLREASTYGHSLVKGNIGPHTYPTYIPQVGDIMQSKYNNFLYEIMMVKEQSVMYHLNQHYVWELQLKAFTDYGISLSAETSASLDTTLTSSINKGKDDIFNISADLAAKIGDINYNDSQDVVEPPVPFSSW